MRVEGVFVLRWFLPGIIGIVDGIRDTRIAGRHDEERAADAGRN